MPTHKLFQNWSWSLKQPAPFDTLSSGELRRKDVYSKFAGGTRKESTIHPCIMQAVLTYIHLENGTVPTGDFSGAIGSQGNELTVCEYPSRNGNLQVVTFNRLNGRFYAGCYSSPLDEDSTPLAYALKDGYQSGAAIFFSLLPSALAEAEFNEQYQKLKEYQEDGFTDMEETAKTAAILCDNLYRRIAYAEGCNEDGIQVSIPAGGNLPLLKPFNLKNGTYAPTNIIAGTFKVLKKSTGTPYAVHIPHNDFIGKYPLSERTLSVHEENSIPGLPQWYIIPQEVKRICEHAHLTTGGQQPMRNFLLRGPAGTGKTPLVEAMRYGYCLELQEPTGISNPGVLVGLNSLLDRCNSVTLPNGELIHRHPDTVIIVTTNSGYAGCKELNQSVISRMNLIMDIPEPEEQVLVERVAGITGCSDLSSIRQMAKFIKQISTYCKETMITDGSCGVRELISWVQSFMICGDIMEAAHYTVLSSVSADEDCRLEVQVPCLETELAA